MEQQDNSALENVATVYINLVEKLITPVHGKTIYVITNEDKYLNFDRGM